MRAHFLVYASVWASWSAWSFCVSDVQVRVRACNTVRGYSCPGANRVSYRFKWRSSHQPNYRLQETKPCEKLRTRTTPAADEDASALNNVNTNAPPPLAGENPWAADRGDSNAAAFGRQPLAPARQRAAPQFVGNAPSESRAMSLASR